MANKANFYRMENSGLTENEINGIRAVFSKYKAIEEALIYGSRAMGNFKPASDIDLTLKGENLDLSLLTQIEFDLDDLMLPYKFDISIYNRITNADFLDHIHRVGRKIYQRKQEGQSIL
jgi:predicted nucleotidyltransferase